MQTFVNSSRRYVRVYDHGLPCGLMVQGTDRVWRSDEWLSGRFGYTVTAGTRLADARQAVIREHDAAIRGRS